MHTTHEKQRQIINNNLILLNQGKNINEVALYHTPPRVRPYQLGGRTINPISRIVVGGRGVGADPSRPSGRIDDILGINPANTPGRFDQTWRFFITRIRNIRDVHGNVTIHIRPDGLVVYQHNGGWYLMDNNGNPLGPMRNPDGSLFDNWDPFSQIPNYVVGKLNDDFGNVLALGAFGALTLIDGETELPAEVNPNPRPPQWHPPMRDIDPDGWQGVPYAAPPTL